MTGPNRRAILAGGAAALMLRSFPAAASPLPGPSGAFTDSVGVNVHISSEPYASNFTRVHEQIAASGIRHLRDELRPGNDIDRWRLLNTTSGILFNILVSPATNSVSDMMNYLTALGPERISAIEGQNEGNSDWFMSLPLAVPGWSGVVVAYQRDIHRALRSRYTAQQLPLLSPSVINWKPADVALIRAAADVSDAVAIHSYVQRAQEPETSDDYAAVSWYLQNMRDAFKPSAPTMATETGYCNMVRPGGSGVSETAAAIYLPRLLLNNYRQGILRTFLYEFMDGGKDPNEWEQNWGLVRNDGTPKPAYHAIRRLLSGLKSARPSERSAKGLRVSPKTASPEIRHISFQDDTGRLVLAIWRAARCWDADKAADIPVDAQPIDITLEGDAVSASFNTPNDDENWRDVPVMNQSLTIPMTGKVVLLRFAA